MSDHTIIDTSTMTGKNKFTFKGLTSAQKIGIIGGGVALTAAIGSAVAYVIRGEDKIDPVEIETSFDKGANDVEDNVSENNEYDATPNDVSEMEYEEDYASFENEDTYDLSFYTEVQFAGSIQNEMSFDAAFLSARSEVGAGGWFNWNGQSYSTFTKEEWSSMSAADQDLFVSEVIDQSQIDTAEWAESTDLSEEIIETEYLMPEEHQITEVQTESAIETNHEEIAVTENTEEVEMTEETINVNTTEEDLSEDIIIVKPIRGADMNEDGIVDAIVFDNDGDGNIDLVALDEDFDGTFESFMINEDGDEDLDVFIIDEGGDGIDGEDSMEEISDVVNMEDFVVLSEEEMPEDLSFIDDIFGDDDIDNTEEIDLGFDDPGL